MTSTPDRQDLVPLLSLFDSSTRLLSVLVDELGTETVWSVLTPAWKDLWWQTFLKKVRRRSFLADEALWKRLLREGDPTWTLSLDDLLLVENHPSFSLNLPIDKMPLRRPLQCPSSSQQWHVWLRQQTDPFQQQRPLTCLLLGWSEWTPEERGRLLAGWLLVFRDFPPSWHERPEHLLSVHWPPNLMLDLLIAQKPGGMEQLLITLDLPAPEPGEEEVRWAFLRDYVALLSRWLGSTAFCDRMHDHWPVTHIRSVKVARLVAQHVKSVPRFRSEWWAALGNQREDFLSVRLVGWMLQGLESLSSILSLLWTKHALEPAALVLEALHHQRVPIEPEIRVRFLQEVSSSAFCPQSATRLFFLAEADHYWRESDGKLAVRRRQVAVESTTGWLGKKSRGDGGGYVPYVDAAELGLGDALSRLEDRLLRFPTAEDPWDDAKRQTRHASVLESWQPLRKALASCEQHWAQDLHAALENGRRGQPPIRAGLLQSWHQLLHPGGGPLTLSKKASARDLPTWLGTTFAEDAMRAQPPRRPRSGQGARRRRRGAY